MTDATSVAADQLRSIVERLADPDGRLSYVCERLLPYAGDKTLFGDRAFKAGAVIWGCPVPAVRHRVEAVAKHGSLSAYLAWLDKPPSIGRPRFGRLPVSAVGYVYKARVRDFPHIIKIGFSSNPKRRMGTLRTESLLHHDLEEFTPGTLLDESIQHLEHRAWSLDREWFLDIAKPKGQIPSFFLPAFSREMVNEVFASENPCPHESGAMRLYHALLQGAA